MESMGLPWNPWDYHGIHGITMESMGLPWNPWDYIIPRFQRSYGLWAIYEKGA
jgi:hypothetical protein